MLEQCLLGDEVQKRGKTAAVLAPRPQHFEQMRDGLLGDAMQLIRVAQQGGNVSAPVLDRLQRVAQWKRFDTESQNAAFRGIDEANFRMAADLAQKEVAVRDHVL